MKITVINGNMRHGSTWNSMNLLVKEIEKKKGVEIREFSLPKDMPHFCNGCFSCIYKGEGTCPHASFVKPIVESMEEADLIILTSPVYGMDVSGQMKALIDHLCYMWMSHRPNPKMFNKVAVTISTTAGAGLSHTTKTMKNSLTFWGVKRIFSLKAPVSAMRWEDVSEKKLRKTEKEVQRLAAKIIKSLDRIEASTAPLFRTIFFFMMKNMMRKNTWNETDRNYWVSKGWISS